MVSGSYQSSLLRFAVGQYRRGVARHRKALGRANSTVRLSAELGTAVVGLPVYVAARASVSAGRRLSAALRGRSLPALSVRVRKLLNFSGFDGMDEIASDLSLDEATVEAVPALVRPMFQMLVAVGHCLSSSQLAELSNPSELLERKASSNADLRSDELEPPGSRLVRWVKKCRVAARRLLNFEDVALTPIGGLVAAKPMQVTGVASDIKTRSLLLVLDYELTWNGLSPAQQQRLQNQIGVCMAGGALVMKQRASAFAFASHWLSMGKALIRRLQWRRDDQPSEAARALLVSTQLAALAGSYSLALSPYSQSYGDRLVTQSSEPEDLSSSLVVPQTASLVSMAVCSEAIAKNDKVGQRDRDAIEADVISTVYVEHPLEKVLKWVDRILLWIETRWRLLKQRLLAQIEAVFHG